MIFWKKTEPITYCSVCGVAFKFVPSNKIEEDYKDMCYEHRKNQVEWRLRQKKVGDWAWKNWEKLELIMKEEEEEKKKKEAVFYNKMINEAYRNAKAEDQQYAAYLQSQGSQGFRI